MDEKVPHIVVEMSHVPPLSSSSSPYTDNYSHTHTHLYCFHFMVRWPVLRQICYCNCNCNCNCNGMSLIPQSLRPCRHCSSHSSGLDDLCIPEHSKSLLFPTPSSQQYVLICEDNHPSVFKLFGYSRQLLDCIARFSIDFWDYEW